VVAAKWLLVIASFYFYSFGALKYLWAFCFTVFFSYLIGRTLSELHKKEQETKSPNLVKRRLLLGIGVIADLSLLGYFKYYNFFLTNFNFITGQHFHLINVILPLGISFYTFQLVAYLVDSYRGITKDINLLNYLLFITFFPQLIVGPIVHHGDVIPQFNNIYKSRLNYRNIAVGLFLLSIGFAKKLLLADPLTGYGAAAFQHAKELSMLESWYASLSYVLSYYFDLSGYGDMAIGLGLLFNINLAVNFNSPYKARNFADYWRRWHISLSNFLGDYVFRNIYKKGDGSKKFYFAVFMTFLVSGIWHGAGWTFVVWGIINGIFVIFSHMMKRNGKELPFLLAWALTFLGVILTRVLFVSSSFGDAFYVTKSLFGFGTFRWHEFEYIDGIKHHILLLAGFFICFFLPNSIEIKNKFKPNFWFFIGTLLLMAFSLSQMGSVKSFLYFQF
jgi:D-alanyl-lipoteichoic acid acyltransferase DltB (MBOAT superfamily)